MLINAYVHRNIVSTVNMGTSLDLKTIALRARNAEYNPKVGLVFPQTSPSRSTSHSILFPFFFTRQEKERLHSVFILDVALWRVFVCVFIDYMFVM